MSSCIMGLNIFRINHMYAVLGLLGTVMSINSCRHGGLSDSESDTAQVYAIYGELRITAGDWIRYLEKDDPGFRDRKMADFETALDEVRTRMSALLLDQQLVQETARMGILDDPKKKLLIESMAMKNLTTWYFKNILPDKLAPDEDLLKRHYRDHIENFKLQPAVSFRMIYMKLKGLDEQMAKSKERLASDLSRQLQLDPDRFGEMALQYSEASLDPRDQGINLSYDRLLGALHKPLKTLDEGRVSDVIRGPDGLYILRLDKQGPEYSEYKVARKTILNALVADKINQYMKDLMASAERDMGFIFPPVPEKLESRTQIVGGRLKLDGSWLAWSEGQEVEDLPGGGILADLIDQTRQRVVLMTVMQDEGTDAHPMAVRIWRDNRLFYLWRFYQEKHMEAGKGITEEMMRDFYEKNIIQFDEGERCKIRECRLIADKITGRSGLIPASEIRDKALEIRRAWEEGSDFETLIREEPLADNREQGGIIRWIDKMSFMTSDIHLETVSGLGVGEVSKPVAIHKGFGLAQVLQREVGDVLPFEKVRTSIHSRLKQQGLRDLQKEFTLKVSRNIQWSIPDELVLAHVGEQGPQQ